MLCKWRSRNHEFMSWMYQCEKRFFFHLKWLSKLYTLSCINTNRTNVWNLKNWSLQVKLQKSYEFKGAIYVNSLFLILKQEFVIHSHGLLIRKVAWFTLISYQHYSVFLYTGPLPSPFPALQSWHQPFWIKDALLESYICLIFHPFPLCSPYLLFTVWYWCELF